MEEFDSWKIAEVVIGLLSSLLGALGFRIMKRVDELERHYVTHKDLSDVVEQMRTDRRQMHEENRGHLDSIESKIEKGNQEQRESRNELIDRVHKIDSKIAAITGDVTGSHRKV